MTRFRAMLAAVLVGALVTACAGDATTPTPDPTPEETPAPTDTPAPPDASPEATFDLPSSDTELEAVLPDTFGDVSLTKFSMRGAEFMTAGDDNEEFVEFLSRMGARPEDVSVAFAFGMSEDFASSSAIFAFRVAGSDTDRLLQEMQGALDEDDVAANWQQAEVGGKRVQQAEAVDELEGGTVYLYGVGDIVFFLSTTDQAAAAEVLSQLP